MKKMPYSTIYIDKHLKYIRTLLEHANQGAGNTDFQWLDNRIQKQAYDWIINSLHDLFFMYTGDGDTHLQLEQDAKAAKESYYIAACVAALCYEMVEKGFPHHVMDSGSPYNFREKNINFSKAAILANEYDLALQIAGTDTVEGALILQDYAKACKILPDGPEGASIAGDQLRQCMWAIAHGDEDRFNKYLENRIKMLRRYGQLNPVPLDSWGLAAIKLANRRGIQCHLDVIELPYSLLGDDRPDTSALAFPREAQIRSILQNVNPAGSR